MGSFLLVLREMATATPPLTEFPMRWASVRLTPPRLGLEDVSDVAAVAGVLVASLEDDDADSGVRQAADLRDPFPRLDTGNPCRNEGVVDGEVTMVARLDCVAEAMPLSAPRPDRTCGGLYWKGCCCR